MINHKNLEAIFNAFPIPCVILFPDSPRFTIAGMNEACCLATNSKESDVINRGLFEAYPDNQNDPNANCEQNLRASLEQVKTTKASHKMAAQQYDILDPGTAELKERYWSPENYPVLNEQGEVELIIHTTTDVTEQVLAGKLGKSIHKALLKNEEHYRSLFDHHPDAVYSFDLDGNFISANQGMARLAGCPIEEIQKMAFPALIPPEDLARVLEHFRKASTGEIQNYDTGLITSGGNRLEINVTNIPILDNNVIIGVYGIAKDITQRKKEEQELIAEKEKFQSLVQTIDGIFWEADAQTFAFTFVSPQAERILGYTPQKWMEDPEFWQKHIYEEDRNEAIKFCHEKTLAGEDHRFEYRMMAADGHLVWFKDVVTIIKENGKPHILQGLMVDISKKKQVEQEVKKSREQLQKIMDHSLDVICAIDDERNIITVSKASEAILGYLPEELEGKPYMNSVFKDDIEAVNTASSQIKNGVSVTRIESRFKKKDGQLITMSWMIQRDAEEKITYCVGRDISDIKASNELVKNNEKRFRTLIQNSNEGISLVAADGTVLERSLSAMKILGITFPQKDEKIYIDLVHDDDRASVNKAISDVTIYPDNVISIEFRITTPQGVNKWVEFTFHNQLEEPAVKAIVVNSRDITEKKVASESLKASEERYRHLFRNNPLPIWIYNSETYRFLEVNLAAIEKYGYSEEEFLKMSILDIRPPEDIELVKKANGIRTDYGIRYERHWRHLKKNGGLLYADITSQIINHEGCKATLVLSNDVTEKINTEAAIRINEGVRRLIMDSALDAIICMDHDGLVTLWNTQAENLFGWSREEMMGKYLANYVIPQQHRLRYKLALQRYLQTGKGFLINSILEKMAIDRNQREFPIELTIISIKQEGSEFFCAFIRDITERKHHETALKLSEQRFKALVQEGSDLICVLDEELKYTYVSPAYTSKMEIKHKDLIGKMPLYRIHKDDRERTSKTSERLKTEKHVKYMPFRFRDGHGRYRWLDSKATNLLGDPSVKGILFNAIDITERMNYIQAIEEQNEKLKAIAWIQSHIVRAPLARIMGLIDLLENHSANQKETSELLGHILTSAHELDEIIRTIVKKAEQLENLPKNEL